MSNGDGLPKGWCWTSTNDLFSFVTSGSRGWAKHYSEYGAIFLRVGNLDHATISLDLSSIQRVDVPDGSEAQRTRVQSGDLLISVTADVGMVGLVPDSVSEAYVNQHVAISRPREGVCRSFLAWYLASQHGGQRQFAALQRGATKAGLGLDDVRAVRVPLAPFNEQRRIVAKIEELFSDLDAGVAALERAKAKLKRYRAAVLKAAVEGKLTEEWRKQQVEAASRRLSDGKDRKRRDAASTNETASQLLERILKERRRKWEEDQLAAYAKAGKKPPANWKDKYKELAASDDTDLPALPEGWCWATLGQCFRVCVGATPSRREPRYWEGSIPWVSSGEIQFCRIKETKEKITELGLANSSTQVNPHGSVLIGMIGEGRTRGQVAILGIDACNNQNCAAIWVSRTPMPPEFVYYWLWSQYEVTRRRSSGNNQPALNKTRVEEIPLPLPPLAEQQQIVSEVERRLSIAQESESQIEANLKRSSRLRQSILKLAFEGKLVPQDPNDEPASMLLEKLRRGQGSKRC